MLIEIGRRIINTDHIVSAEPAPARAAGATWRLTLTTGEAITLDDPRSSLTAVCGTIVPAQPGFLAVEAFLPGETEPDGSIHYRMSTVLAFRIVPGACAPAPITAEGEVFPNEDVLIAVVDPSGHCVEAGTPYESLDAFKARCEAIVAGRRTEANAEADRNEPQPEPDTSPAPSDAAESDPTAELRTLILAEPIRPVGGRALWRDGQDFAEAVDAVRQARADVHAYGVGYDRRWGWKWGADGLEKARAEMTGPSSVEQFERAVRFLSYAGHRFRRPAAANRKRSSYSWKHAAERVMGGYVSNGMLIAAAYALGFLVATEKDSPNAWINLSEEAISLDPGKGMT